MGSGVVRSISIAIGLKLAVLNATSNMFENLYLGRRPLLLDGWNIRVMLTRFSAWQSTCESQARNTLKGAISLHICCYISSQQDPEQAQLSYNYAYLIVVDSYPSIYRTQLPGLRKEGGTAVTYERDDHANPMLYVGDFFSPERNSRHQSMHIFTASKVDHRLFHRVGRPQDQVGPASYVQLQVQELGFQLVHGK